MLKLCFKANAAETSQRKQIIIVQFNISLDTKLKKKAKVQINEILSIFSPTS